MANYKIDGNSLHISGDISINDGESLYHFLKDLPFSSKSVNVNLKRAESWDTSTLQLFISWIKSSEMEIFWKNIPEEMKKDLKLTGLSGLFKEVKK
jgi:ABC-type transporter Mla MlaB component